ncbi:MAG: hypothetical protein CRN43_11500, partial [Candidatus Nephrothrix sp. EaCA]
AQTTVTAATNLEHSATAAGVYSYVAVLKRDPDANAPLNAPPECELRTPAAVLTVQQFDLAPLAVPNVCSGGEAVFSSVLTNSGGNAPIFTWQANASNPYNPALFTTVSNGGTNAIVSTTGDSKLTVTDNSAAGHKYRLKAENGDICAKYTDTVSFRVKPLPTITQSPSSGGCIDAPFVLSAKGGTEGQTI